MTLRPLFWSNGRGERMRDSVGRSEREGGTPSPEIAPSPRSPKATVLSPRGGEGLSGRG